MGEDEGVALALKLASPPSERQTIGNRSFRMEAQRNIRRGSRNRMLRGIRGAYPMLLLYPRARLCLQSSVAFRFAYNVTQMLQVAEVDIHDPEVEPSA